MKLRWVQTRDYPILSAQAIENGLDWTADKFRNFLRCRNVVGMIAHDDQDEEEIRGTLLYELLPNAFSVFYLVINKENAYDGIDKWIMRRLMDKCQASRSPNGRRKIVAAISEGNLAFQKFLKKMGFIARKPTDADRADGQYHFTWDAAAATPALV